MTTVTLAGIERAEFFDLAAEQTEIVCRNVNGLRFLVSTADHGTGRALFLRGRRPDMRTLPAVVETLRQRGAYRNGAFVDVGANIGTTTLTAVASGGFLSAIALEPDAENAALIAASAALNGIADRVRVIRAAALDHSRGARLLRHASSSTRHTIDSDGETEVPSVTLDELELYGVVGLLWIDAEGSEGQVLAGARDLLRQRPPIVLEFNPESLRAHDGLAAVLEVASRYSESVHARTAEPLDLERLAVELDGRGGKETRRVDVLLIP